jgi:ribose transport system substrate-binding protein
MVTHYSQAPSADDLLPGAQPVSAKPQAGKRVVFLQCPFSVCQSTAKVIQSAGKALGWKVSVISESSSAPPAVAKIWDTLVQSPPDAILSTDAVPQSAFKSQLAALRAKGVVFSGGAIDPSSQTLAAVVGSPDFAFRGQLLADWIITQTKGKANTAIFNVPAFAVLDTEINSLKQEYAKNCPGCSIDVQNESVSDVGQSLPGTVAAYVQAHPDVNYLVFAFGDMMPGVTSALKSAGVDPSKLGIVSAAGDPLNFQNIAAKNYETANVAEDLGITAYRLVDSLVRHWDHQSAGAINKLEYQHEPYRYITAGDVGQVIDSSHQFHVLPPAQEAAFFEHLWRVK